MKRFGGLVLVAFSLLAGCAQPLPEDKQDYVGLWKSDDTSLRIGRDGRLAYEYASGGSGAVKTSSSLEAPIKELTDERITAGVLFLSKTFVIDRRPAADEHGVWSIVVDGKELFRTDEQGRLPQATVVPRLEELRSLVAADLRRLDKGIHANDFTEYRENASLAYQSQFSNERLKEIYKPFVDAGLALDDYMVGELVLTSEPFISPEGVLTIRGRYPREPTALHLEAKFVYVHPQWRSLGGNVRIAKM